MIKKTTKQISVYNAPTLEDEILLLRPLKISDAKMCVTAGWKNQYSKPITTIEQAKSYLKHISKKADGYYVGVFLKENNQLIGDLELCHLQWFDDQAGEICYGIHKDYRGKGYATRASSILIDYLFNKIGLHKIYADTDPNNLASQKVLTKLGFKQEGRIRDKRMIDGKWIDEIDYGLLKTEWKNSYKKK